VGAALLAERAAMAALRTGAGLVTLVVPHSMQEVYGKRVTESMLMFLPDIDGEILFDKPCLEKIIDKADCIVIGMGLGGNKELKQITDYLINNSDIPIMLDADGINCYEGFKPKFRSRVILTPHPKEFERISGVYPAEPATAAKEYADYSGAVVHLKGTESVTAAPDSDTVYINKSYGSELAKGGSGDVLSGIIGALVMDSTRGQVGVQRSTRPLSPLCYLIATAAEVHRRAAHLAAETMPARSVIASDVVEFIPKVMD